MIDWRNNINGFDLFAVSGGKGNSRRLPSGHLRDAIKEHKKTPFRISSRCDKGAQEDSLQDIFKLTPATVANSEIFCQTFPASLSCPVDTTDTPFAISVKKPVQHSPLFRCVIRDFYRAERCAKKINVFFL